MIIQCKSCLKSFSVPDEAVKKNGRLVQCGSCGNKWTQFPQVNEVAKKADQPKIDIKTRSSKVSFKKKKSTKKQNPYTKEYLRQKHGIKIINPSSLSVKTKSVKEEGKFGFYSYITILLVFIITLFGVLNLMEEIIIYNYPAYEKYIYYLFETINNIKIIIQDIFNDFY